MSRRRKWLTVIGRGVVLLLAASIAGIVLLLVTFVVVSKSGSPTTTENPGLKLQFAGFTNISSQWYAQMVLTNQSGDMHFVSTSGSIPEYWGEAVTPTGTNELHAIHFTGGPADLPAQGSSDFRVKFPKHTESWQITVSCMRSDPFSRNLVKWSHWFSGWPNWLVPPTARIFLYPTWDRDFEVSSGVLTNRPPEP